MQQKKVDPSEARMPLIDPGRQFPGFFMDGSPQNSSSHLTLARDLYTNTVVNWHVPAISVDWQILFILLQVIYRSRLNGVQTTRRTGMCGHCPTKPLPPDSKTSSCTYKLPVPAPGIHSSWSVVTTVQYTETLFSSLKSYPSFPQTQQTKQGVPLLCT